MKYPTGTESGNISKYPHKTNQALEMTCLHIFPWWICLSFHCTWDLYCFEKRMKGESVLEVAAVFHTSAVFGICLRILTTPLQQRYLCMFSDPESGSWLQVVAIISCMFVVISTICLIFSTLPAFQRKDGSANISRE